MKIHETVEIYSKSCQGFAQDCENRFYQDLITVRNNDCIKLDFGCWKRFFKLILVPA